MDRAKIVSELENCGVIAVIRAESTEQAVKTIDACIAGGIKGIEVAFTVNGAAGIISELSKQYDGTDVIIGAGTVLDPETARTAILAGAKFVVSPCLNVETVKLCNRYQIPVMAGAMTPKEAVDCVEAGSDIVKIFPASLFGPAIIKAFKGPLPQIKMMPTGGVNKDNCADWIKAGACAVGAGSDLTAGSKTGDYAAVTAIAKEMVANVAAARKAKAAK